ncbi:hypothetical protein ACFVUS_08395 [Nocardia sp. NPDC058058]|uniref:hypothetical protein n=1 Tax=Nocardia sp. NPDC058058 TaxID=3346317 RepID=UPI0036D9EAF9
MRDYREMCELFDANHLGEPPIPARFRSKLTKLGEWAYATRDIDPLAMYLFDQYPHEAERERVEDYVAVCHAGHGINSYAVTYQLTIGSLALFAQAGWGGIDDDRVAGAAKVRDMFNACAMLADIAEMTPACPSHQLILTYSDFRSSRFRWHTRPGAPECSVGPDGLERERGRRAEASPLPLFAFAAHALEGHPGPAAHPVE